jgi:hypothetical protein
MKCFLAILAFSALTAGLPGQYPISAVALNWNGMFPQGTACWGFNCVPLTTNIVRGETGSLTVRGDLNYAYVIGLSFSANRCQSFPTAYNMLVLDDPIFIVLGGTLTTGSPILACPPATSTLPITIPASWPPGISFTLQAMVNVPFAPGSTNPTVSFSQAITFTVI